MIIDKLHQQFPNLPELRMREIRVDKQQRRVYLTLSYPRSDAFGPAVKTAITEAIRGQIPKGYYSSVKFTEDAFTANTFLRNICELLKERYPVYSIGRQDISVEVADKNIDVVLNVTDSLKKNLELVDLVGKLSEHYADYTSYNVNFSIQSNGNGVASAGVEEQEKLVRLAINKELMRPSRHFTITDQRILFGKTIASSPMYIADLREPLDNCTVCGVISAKSNRQSKNNPLLCVCSFMLTDSTSGSIPCVLFVRLQITDPELIMSERGCGMAEAKTLAEKRVLANERRTEEIRSISDGTPVAVRGKAVYGRNGQLELHVYDMCECTILPISKKQFDRPVADEYLLVKPEDFTEYRQLDFVNEYSGRSPLQDTNYVVLHVNATGYANVTEDKLYALCAVRVKNGHVSERLFSYVNPEKEVDEKALSRCRLSQSELIFYPTLTEIISDVYKFTYGSTLVGNDLPQIIQLLDYYAAPMNYKFDNPTVSQAELLSDLFESSTFTASPNFGKLEDVAKKCKVACSDPIFCFETAMTVAKCMSTLSDHSK